MTLKLISIIIFFFEHYNLEIAKSKYIIHMDFDIQFDILVLLESCLKTVAIKR